MPGTRVMGGMFVRVTTEHFSGDGVPAGTTGLTLGRTKDSRWMLSCGGEYVYADEEDFEVLGSALRPRSVVLPSLSGGFLDIRPYHARAVSSPALSHSVSRWGREPIEGSSAI